MNNTRKKDAVLLKYTQQRPLTHKTMYCVFMTRIISFVSLQIGKQNQYELGKFIRKRYAGFLDAAYSPDRVTFVSTDVDRAKMSAQLVAAAAYKPVGKLQWNRHLDWLPVPIRSEPLNNDRVMTTYYICTVLFK